MYQALYRKYRPLDFDSVIGQNGIVKTLKNSIKNKTFSHAYMFFGPRGTGKTTVSKIFARNVNCLDSKDGLACGKCDNCKISSEKECVDIIEIDAASNNGVDEIRELKSKIALVPAELKYKVYIVDEVHMLSMGAFNALLKTLEEPPEHAIFILATTDPQNVPDTIISRCQCFSFKKMSIDNIFDRLKYVVDKEKIKIDDEVLNQIAVATDGGMRDALGLLDKLSSYSDKKITLDDFAELNGSLINSELKEFSDNLFTFNVEKVIELLNKYDSDGKNIIQILNQLLFYLRDVLVNYYTKKDKCSYDIDLVLNFVNLLNSKMNDIKLSDNSRVYVEILLLKFIKDNKNDLFLENSVVEKENDHILAVKEENIEPKVTKKEEQEKENDKEESNKVELDENLSIDRENDDISVIKNINEIIDARVNNIMAQAEKTILINETKLFESLREFSFDQQIGYLVCDLLDGKVRAASNDGVIISYEFESAVNRNLLFIEKLTYIYNKITSSNKDLALITDERWENEKKNYIKLKKDGKKLELLEIPNEIYEEKENNDIISNSAVELFGDIVEIN